MPSVSSPWQTHARQRIAATTPEPKPAPHRMEWTQHRGHGPGAEILGDLRNRRVLELGCGAGHNLAHLAAHSGAKATGIDAASLQIHRARAHYGYLANAKFLAADALLHLHATQPPFDAIYSVFGAIGLTDPAQLLPAVAARLTNGGRLAFSVPHPRRQSRHPTNRSRIECLTLPDGRSTPINRWELAEERWAQVLTSSGVLVAAAQDIFAPGDSQWPATLLIIAHRA